MTNPLDEQRAARYPLPAHVEPLRADIDLLRDMLANDNDAWRALCNVLEALIAPPLCAKGEVEQRLRDAYEACLYNVPAALALAGALAPGFRLIYRDAFRWKNAAGDVLPNHYDGQDIGYLAEEFGYRVAADLGFAAVIHDEADTTPAQPADGVEVLWRGFRHDFDGEGDAECFDHKDPDCKTCEPVVLIRESDYRTLAASKADSAQVSPSNCRERLRAEGKPYPRSGCSVCKTGGLTGCPYERAVHAPTPQPEGGRGEAVLWVNPEDLRIPSLTSMFAVRATHERQGKHYTIPLYATPTDAARVRDAALLALANEWVRRCSTPECNSIHRVAQRICADELRSLVNGKPFGAALAAVEGGKA